MFILKYPFPVLLAAHAMIPAAPGPGQDGVSAAQVGALGALHTMTARVCSSIGKPSRVWQALAHVLSQKSGWPWSAHPYGPSRCPFSSKAVECLELGARQGG